MWTHESSLYELLELWSRDTLDMSVNFLFLLAGVMSPLLLLGTLAFRFRPNFWRANSWSWLGSILDRISLKRRIIRWRQKRCETVSNIVIKYIAVFILAMRKTRKVFIYLIIHHSSGPVTKHQRHPSKTLQPHRHHSCHHLQTPPPNNTLTLRQTNHIKPHWQPHHQHTPTPHTPLRNQPLKTSSHTPHPTPLKLLPPPQPLPTLHQPNHTGRLPRVWFLSPQYSSHIPLPQTSYFSFSPWPLEQAVPCHPLSQRPQGSYSAPSRSRIVVTTHIHTPVIKWWIFGNDKVAYK